MKLGNFILKLQEIQKQHGDDLNVFWDNGSGMGFFEVYDADGNLPSRNNKKAIELYIYPEPIIE